MPVSFIHVGMMKAASTYLQNVWLNDEQYALAFAGVQKVVQYVRSSTLCGNFDADHPMHIKLDKQPARENNIIISSEGFSCGYLATTEERPLREMIGNAAKILGTLKAETNNVLICVRSPVSWLSSMHSQFINEGQYGDWTRFYRYKEQFLKDALNLEFILSCYEEHFSNVVVIPVEYLKNDESTFWSILSSRFDCPRPNLQVEMQNESLKGNRLLLLSKLNQLSDTMRAGLTESDVSSAQETRLLVENDSKYSKWLHRRFCQHSTDAKLSQACELLEVDGGDEVFRKVFLSQEMTHWIEAKFIKPIENRVNDRDLMKAYREELLGVPRF